MDRFFQLLRHCGFWIALTAVLALIAIFLFGFEWRPANQVRKQQMALLLAGEKGSESKLNALISADYSDPWGLNKQQILMAFKDARQQFFVMQVVPSDVQLQLDGETATVTSMIEFRGTGPYAEVLMKEINGLKSPWVFTWKKEGSLPWEWRLIRMENADMPTLRGYQPGNLGGMMESL